MSDFAKDLQKFATDAQIKIKRARDGICLKLFSGVVMASPVGTNDPDIGYYGGTLRANWQCSLNTPIRTPLEKIDPGGAETIGKVAVALDEFALGDNTIMLTNNMPYSYIIEYEGHSHTKAPNGMVRINVDRILNLLHTRGVSGVAPSASQV